jgi:hypothetical protein
MIRNNFWHGKRALYILISLIVEDLSACVHVVTGFQRNVANLGRLALTRLIPMAMLVIISASQVLFITYLVIVTKVHSNTDM